MSLSESERNQIQTHLDRTKATTAEVVETISRLNASLVVFKERSYQTMSEIRTAADMVVNEIRAHEEKLVAEVQEIINLKEECVQQQRRALEDYIAELQQSIDYTNDILNSPTQPDIDEWKSALKIQLTHVNNMKDGYNFELNMDDEGKLLFVYAKQDLLKSIANYGTIINHVPESFRLNYHDDDFREEQATPVSVIPVVTLNGTVVDLDAVTELESDEESSEEESESGENYESTNDEDEEDDEDADDDDNDDNNNHDVVDDGVDVDRPQTKKAYSSKPKLSTLI